jgi:hypothetical protein
MRMTILKTLAKKVRQRELGWRYVFNLRPTLSYRMNRPVLSGEAARVLRELNRNGVAITSARDFLGTDSCYPQLEAAVAKLEQDLAGKLAARRTIAETQTQEDIKLYLLELLGERPRLDPNDIFVRFALQHSILRLANAYVGMYTHLRYFNVWHNFTTRREAAHSQLWHYDHDDAFYVFKVFVLLSDVDEDSGPFTYARGTHTKWTARREPEFVVKDGNAARSTDEQMAKIVPPERWLKGIGPKGTIIFADTRGYHKGGYARKRDRLLYTCVFTSPLARRSPESEFYTRPAAMNASLDREQAFALSPGK